MKITGEKLGELLRFFSDAFTPDQLDRFLTYNGYEAVVGSVSKVQTPDGYFDQVAKELRRRNLIDSTLFAKLREERKQSKALIDAIESSLLYPTEDVPKVASLEMSQVTVQDPPAWSDAGVAAFELVNTKSGKAVLKDLLLIVLDHGVSEIPKMVEPAAPIVQNQYKVMLKPTEREYDVRKREFGLPAPISFVRDEIEQFVVELRSTEPQWYRFQFLIRWYDTSMPTEVYELLSPSLRIEFKPSVEEVLQGHRLPNEEERNKPTPQLVNAGAQSSAQSDDVAIPVIVKSSKPLELMWCWIPDHQRVVLGSKDKADEGPLQEVSLENFWMARYPVTNEQYSLFIEANGYGNKDWWSTTGWQWLKEKDIREPEYWTVERWNRAERPVVGVSWYEAEAFCNWAADVTGEQIRLPLEQEWEKAARGEDRRKYPWGNNNPTNRRCNFDHNLGGTTPVGLYSPTGDSPYGCGDMAGNVWEWTGSWYDAYPGSQKESDAFGEFYRVIRGGSWHDDELDARTSNRGKLEPWRRFDYLGFRCVCIPSSTPTQSFVTGEQFQNDLGRQSHFLPDKPEHSQSIRLEKEPEGRVEVVDPTLVLPSRGERFLPSAAKSWLIDVVSKQTTLKLYPAERNNLLLESGIPEKWIDKSYEINAPIGVFAGTVINDLEIRGSLPRNPKKHALGALLEKLATDLFGYEDAVKTVALIFRYQLNIDHEELNQLSEQFGVPLQTFKEDSYKPPWQPPSGLLPPGLHVAELKRKLEALHHRGRANWLDVEIFEEGARAARSVCRLEWGKKGEGTGFLVAPDLILTNYHVIEIPTGYAYAEGMKGRLKNCEVRFGATRTSRAGKRVVKLHEQALVKFSKPDQLDYALLRLNEPVEDEERVVRARLSSEKISRDQYANIIQHPLRGTMKVALRNNQVVELAPHRVYYLSDTEQGSSGSPVFDDNWEVIALHRAGGLEDESGEVLMEANEGIPILDIVREIEEDLHGGE